jgi:hypothetical protein
VTRWVQNSDVMRDLVVLVNQAIEAIPAPNEGGSRNRIGPSPDLDTCASRVKGCVLSDLVPSDAGKPGYSTPRPGLQDGRAGAPP